MNVNTNELVTKARIFATEAHGDQQRKYTGEPYIVHPLAVLKIVSTVKDHTPEMLAAAILHDVVEDTPVTINVIEDIFGKAVAKLVFELTDVSKPEDGNRAIRKALDKAHLVKASPEAQTIKYADMLDNTRDIAVNDKNFAKVYIKEIRSLWSDMTKGDKTLYADLEKVIQECEKNL